MRELADQVRLLTERVNRLEGENQALRGGREVAADEAPTESPRLHRRGLLRLGGAVAAAGAGAVLLRPGTAGATTAAMSFGAENDAGTDSTGLTSSNATDTLHIANTSPSGASNAIHATNDGTDLFSTGVWGEMTDDTSLGAGVVGTSTAGIGVVGSVSGSGPAVWAIAGSGPAVWALSNDAGITAAGIDSEHHGTGPAVYAHIEASASAAAAVKGRTAGTGPGVDAASTKGVGGKFAGKTAQVQLVPSTATTHPKSGGPGQLFVDKSKRLWYCKGGTTWKQLA